MSPLKFLKLVVFSRFCYNAKNIFGFSKLFCHNTKIFNFFYIKFLYTVTLRLRVIWIFKKSFFFLFLPFERLTINLRFFFIEKRFFFFLLIIFLRIILFSIFYVFYYFNFFYNMIMLIFCFSIIILIFHKNIYFLMLGWDGLGVTSFILVFYYINWTSLNRSLVTVLTNRLGDISLIFFFIYFLHFEVEKTFFFFRTFSIFLFFALITKRAQFPFSSWLPQAISAPTPTRALVHSRTLVTAGIYLILKYFLFLSTFFFISIFFFFGFITFLVSGYCSIFEKDLKKIIALRTLNQLGFMMFSLRFINKFLTFFHLCSHAFFKRCLFLQIGFFIHSNFSNQDSRGFNFSLKNRKISTFFFFFCLLRMCGLIFLRGFITKERILLIYTFRNFYFLNYLFIYFMIFFTIFYSIILFFNYFQGNFFFFNFDFSFVILFSSLFIFCIGMFIGTWIRKSFFIIFFSFGNKERIFLLLYVFIFFFFINVKKKREVNKIIFQDSFYKITKKVIKKDFFIFDIFILITLFNAQKNLIFFQFRKNFLFWHTFFIFFSLCVFLN